MIPILDSIVKKKGRTGLLLRQFSFSFLARIMSMVFGLAFVRYAMNIFGGAAYGVYFAITSAVAFINLAEGGVGAGIRNKLTEALAEGDEKTARGLVSSSYAQLFLMLVPIGVIASFVNWLAPWPEWINLSQESSPEQLRWVMEITIIGALATLWLGLVSSVAASVGVQSLQSLVLAAGAFLSCLGVVGVACIMPYALSVVTLALIAVGGPIISAIIWSLWFYNGRPVIRPSLDSVSFNAARTILGFGGKVFIINITDYFLFTAATIQISSLYGASVVAELAVGQRLFMILQTIFGMLAFASGTPLIEARVSGDWVWVRRYIVKISLFSTIMCVLTVAVTLLMPVIVRLWIGPDMTISPSLLWMQCLVAVVCYWNTFFRSVLISMNRLREILICGIIGMALALASLAVIGSNFGPGGSLFAVFLGLIPSLTWLPLKTCSQISALEKRHD